MKAVGEARHSKATPKSGRRIKVPGTLINIHVLLNYISKTNRFDAKKDERAKKATSTPQEPSSRPSNLA